MSGVEFDEENLNTVFSKRGPMWAASFMQKIVIRLGLAKTTKQADTVLAFIAIVVFVLAIFFFWNQVQPTPQQVPFTTAQLKALPRPITGK